MIVKVTGIENFVGNNKARYLREPLLTTAHPSDHHQAFARQLDDAVFADRGVVPESERHALVERWEADPRSLIADMVRTPDGRISYVLWEVP